MHQLMRGHPNGWMELLCGEGEVGGGNNGGPRDFSDEGRIEITGMGVDRSRAGVVEVCWLGLGRDKRTGDVRACPPQLAQARVGELQA